MKYEPTHVTKELVDQFKGYYSITYREALEVAGFKKEAISANDKALLLNFIEQRLDKVNDEEYHSIVGT